MSENLKIRSDISLSLHPDAITPHSKTLSEDTVGHAAYRACREGLATMYTTLAAINDAERALLATIPKDAAIAGGRPRGNVRAVGGRVVVPPERAAELAEAATAAFERGAPVVDRRKKEIEDVRTKLAARVHAAIFTVQDNRPERIAQAAEIRGHFKAEKSPFKLIADAIKAGDRQTAAAVLSAPAFLSGLTAKQHAELQSLAEKTFAPEDSAQVAACDAVLDHLMRASQTFVGRYGEIVGPREPLRAMTAAATARLRELTNGK